MILTPNEKKSVLRVFGDEGVRLITQEPGLGGGRCQNQPVDELSVRQLVAVLKAGMIGVATALDDVKFLTCRMSEVGQELLVRSESKASAQAPGEEESDEAPVPKPGVRIKIKIDVLIKHRYYKGDTLAEIADRITSMEDYGDWTAERVLDRINDLKLPDPPAATTTDRAPDPPPYAVNRKKLIERIKALHNKGLGPAAISRQLNEEGFKNQRGNPITGMGVSSVLQAEKLTQPRQKFTPDAASRQIIENGWVAGATISRIIDHLTKSGHLRNGEPWTVGQVSVYARKELKLPKREPGIKTKRLKGVLE